MKIELRSINTIGFAKYNPRKISDRDLNNLVQSIERFGFVDPLIVNDRTGTLVGGHQRIKAAKKLGLKDVPVVAVDLSEVEEKALNVALNKISGEWDLDLLRGVLEDVQAGGLDLSLTGFTEDEWSAMSGTPAGTAGLTDPDEVPELPEQAETITQPGDLWLLGGHRLLCGDSTKAEDVTRLMDGAKADLIWTDPPYGVSHIGGTKDPRRKTHRTGGVVHNDEKTGAELISLVSSAIGNIPRHEATVLYVASPPGSHVREMIDAFNASGFQFRHSLVWVKSAFVFGRADYHYQHELVLYGWGEKHEWTGPRNLATVFEFPRGDKGIEHPTSKPVGLVAGTAQNHPAATMADPFCGSGTTIIAAEQLGRKCYGLEISPQYCDVIVRRWEQFTGRKASRAG